MQFLWNSANEPNETTVKGQSCPNLLRMGRRTVSAAIAKLQSFAEEITIRA